MMKIEQLNDDYAIEIANHWKYPDPSSFYNMTADPEAFIKLARQLTNAMGSWIVITTLAKLTTTCFSIIIFLGGDQKMQTKMHCILHDLKESVLK